MGYVAPRGWGEVGPLAPSNTAGVSRLTVLCAAQLALFAAAMAAAGIALILRRLRMRQLAARAAAAEANCMHSNAAAT